MLSFEVIYVLYAKAIVTKLRVLVWICTTSWLLVEVRPPLKNFLEIWEVVRKSNLL